MSDAPVLYESSEAIATITLNRPENRNSMTPDVMQAFRAAVARAAADETLRAVIVTGRGRSFCAGADFKTNAPPESDPGPSEPDYERLYRTYEPFLDVFDLPVPTIGALNGHAIGGGFGLALVCDIRVANREARYGANFARLGFHSGMAISYLLPRIVGVPAAADLLFSGRLVSGADAAALGLAHEAVAADAVLPAAQRRAREIAGCAPQALRLLKRSLYAGADWNPRRAARAEAFAQAATIASEDAREGIRALLEKREPVFRGR
ncbi:MAG: enoyl-CoA hydratase/isomerase family protein [Myxococcota bacterium]|nr:enoyl-CoA hydratase/isomerase family protein [Myxococcota bacterium]